ncbi:hypothetical protein HPB50_000314 [Hyalomma asiaticum]|uniref:Uncharacterized protein n=1 Tax=Hyalomma asiaticum TaxID=266040 RepID=A0ACB7RTF5_HYAAI|nr:hypothetical protein HPB50_000314 [Hyalomma asiaticum]
MFRRHGIQAQQVPQHTEQDHTQWDSGTRTLVKLERGKVRPDGQRLGYEEESAAEAGDDKTRVVFNEERDLPDVAPFAVAVPSSEQTRRVTGRTELRLPLISLKAG